MAAATLADLFYTATVAENGCNITQIAPNVYRISSPVPVEAFPPFGFTFNSFLLVDESPLLVHTGMKQLFPGVKAAVERVIPLEKLRYIFACHHEADEDGSLIQWLDAVPNAQLIASSFGQALHWTDQVNGKREIHTLNEGDELTLGKHKVRWVYTPHLPHGWECGYLFETTNRLLFSGDIFSQRGHNPAPLIDDEEKLFTTAGGIYGFWKDSKDPFEPVYMPRNAQTEPNFAKLIALNPQYLLSMHGSSFKGDGAAALRRLHAMIK